MTVKDRVILFDQDQARAASIAAALESLGVKTIPVHRGIDATTRLHGETAGVVVVVGGEGRFPGVAAAASISGMLSVGVIEPSEDPRALAESARGFDDWASLASPAIEIAARVANLLGRGPNRPASAQPAIDARFLALAVHDLRTPLNVLVLTNRSIGHSVTNRTADFVEDLTYLTDNTRQLEKMLANLGDYCRLIEPESSIWGTEFDPRRFLSDFLEDRKERSGTEPTPVRLELVESCPHEVCLDQNRARLALSNALANAVIAAGDSPVRLRASGKPGRLVVEMIVDRPPPETVMPVELRSDTFERLVGSTAERRGLDLAIAARVTELFGGSARLELEPGLRSSIVLEWPERLEAP